MFYLYLYKLYMYKLLIYDFNKIIYLYMIFYKYYLIYPIDLCHILSWSNSELMKFIILRVFLYLYALQLGLSFFPFLFVKEATCSINIHEFDNRITKMGTKIW